MKEGLLKQALPMGALKRLGQLLGSRGALAGMGAAAGAGGLLGLQSAGANELQNEQEAEELRQLLEQYPELMNEPMMGEQQF
jgi:hypothetical protein